MRVRLEHTFTGHAAPVYHVSYMNELVYSSAADSMLATWDLNKLEPNNFSVKAECGLYTHHLTENTGFLGNSKGHIHVIDLKTKTELKNLAIHANGVYAICSSQNYLISGGGGGVVNFIDLQTFELVRSLKLSNKKIRSLALGVDGLSVLIGCGEGVVREVELDYFNETSTQSVSEKSINTISIHPKKTAILTAGTDGFVRVLKQDTLELLMEFPAHYDSVYTATFSPDGNYLLTISKDKSIKVWNSATLELVFKTDIKTEGTHRASVNTAAWISNTQFVTAGDDKTIKLWKF